MLRSVARPRARPALLCARVSAAARTRDQWGVWQQWQRLCESCTPIQGEHRQPHRRTEVHVAVSTAASRGWNQVSATSLLFVAGLTLVSRRYFHWSSSSVQGATQGAICGSLETADFLFPLLQGLFVALTSDCIP